MMTDEALLADVAATEHSAFEADASLRAAAFSRVDDRELLLQLMDHYRNIHLGNVKRSPSIFQGSEVQGDKIMRDAVTDAYERIERPPFEWNMIMDGEKATTNLLLDLDGMSYPKDRENLLRVALEKDGDVAAKAVSMLPYEQERGTLREIIARGKDEARMAALKKMRLPEDRDPVVACLFDHSAGKPVKLLAARLLTGHDAVDIPCHAHLPQLAVLDPRHHIRADSDAKPLLLGYSLRHLLNQSVSVEVIHKHIPRLWCFLY